MSKVFILVFSALLLFTGCSKESSNEIGFGVIDSNVYKNSYFAMSIAVPDGWVVQSQAAQKALMDVGTGLISGGDKNLNSVLKESQKQTVNLFSFFKHELGAPVEFNPSIIAVAERVSQTPGVKRGSDYNYHVKKVLTSGQMNYEFPNDAYSKDISGVLFDVMPAQITINGITVYQEYYTAKFNDYMLAIILTYSNDAELVELTENLSALRFSK